MLPSNTVSSTSGKTPYRNAIVFWALIFLFVSAQVLKLIFVAPAPELGGDAAQKWDVARDIANGSLEVFRSKEFINHHYLRWGGWFVSSGLIWAFSDDLLYYYLSTFLPAIAAALVFFALFDRNFGTVATACFAVFWMFDPDMNRATFQLLPTGAAWLPLALILLCFHRAIEGRLGSTSLAVLCAILLFWMYGAKETNIFFAPGLIAALWFVAGTRAAAIFVVTGIVFYVVEWLVLQAMLGSPLFGGRLLALLFEDAGHLKGMRSNPMLVEQQANLWDAGIISRWYSVSYFHLPIYLPAILCSFIVLVMGGLRYQGATLPRLGLACAMLFLSFVLLTSSFILSFDPIILGQPIIARYVWIALPLAVFLLIFTLQRAAPAWAFNRAQPIAAVGAIIAVASIVFVVLTGSATTGAVAKAHRLLTFEISQPTAPVTEWQSYYEGYDPVYSSATCKTNMGGTQDLIGLTYVPDRSGGSALRAAYIACLDARETE